MDSAALAQADYHGDPELTGFEAFGTKDMYGGSAGTGRREILADRFRPRGKGDSKVVVAKRTNKERRPDWAS